MELQEIEVEIGPDGTTRVRVHGVPGPGCLDVTAALEAALGGEVVSRELTADNWAEGVHAAEQRLTRDR
jgi:Protein of unknown function (DUF2997)